MKSRQRVTTKKARLMLEELESRWVPALFTSLSSSGLLTIGNGTATGGTPGGTPATLLVAINGDGTVDVTSGANLIVNDAPASSINIRLSNVASATTIDTAAGAFGGSISYTAGNGADSVTVTGANAIGGNLSITTGTSADSITIDTTPINGSLTVNVSTGNDTVTMTGAVVSGAANISGANTFNADAATTLGSLGFNSSSDSLPDILTIDAVIVGSANISTSTAGADSITFGGTVGGFLNINAGNGANSITINDNAVALDVGSNLIIQAGLGADTVTLNATEIGNNVTMTLGDGNNVVSVVMGAEIFGTQATIITGNGADSVSFDGTASGKLTALLGNGNDSFTYEANALVGSDYLDGGLGVNILTLNAAITWPFTHVNFE